LSFAPFTRLFDASFPDDPYLETAVSAALLRQVARGEIPPAARLNRTAAILAFGKLDRLRPGYRRAVALARAAGYAPVERIAGGRAAVFHAGTISLSVTIRAAGPTGAYPGTRDRFATIADLIAAALARAGIDARRGAVDGEYCPGEFSVNARDAVKLAGIGQRVVAGGAHVGAVIVVRGAGAVNAALDPVNAALGIAWDPAVTGSVAGELGEDDAPPPADEPDPLIDRTMAALRVELEGRTDLQPATLPRSTLELAQRIKDDYRPRT
jgi:lipoate-protein ligase A